MYPRSNFMYKILHDTPFSLSTVYTKSSYFCTRYGITERNKSTFPFKKSPVRLVFTRSLSLCYISFTLFLRNPSITYFFLSYVVFSCSSLCIRYLICACHTVTRKIYMDGRSRVEWLMCVCTHENYIFSCLMCVNL